jgi:PadR family transcriptional regulator PadR
LKTLGFVEYNWKESTQGPPRKYYSLTDSGKKHMKELTVSWKEIDNSVKKIINSKLK